MWRHDSVLNCLLTSDKTELQPTSLLYADIPLWRASVSPPATITVSIIIQGCRFGTMEPQVVPKGLVWCQERIFWCQIIRVG